MALNVFFMIRGSYSGIKKFCDVPLIKVLEKRKDKLKCNL